MRAFLIPRRCQRQPLNTLVPLAAAVRRHCRCPAAASPLPRRLTSERLPFVHLARAEYLPRDLWFREKTLGNDDLLRQIDPLSTCLPSGPTALIRRVCALLAS